MKSTHVNKAGFTLIELLVVIGVIGVLASLVLGVAGIATKKAAEAKAKTDLERVKDALEEFRLDRGYYPVVDTAGTEEFSDLVDVLYTSPINNGEDPYLEEKDLDLSDPSGPTMRDPWGTEYHYIHRANWPYATHNNSKYGYDLWSTGPNTLETNKWITNWRDVGG